MTRVISLRRKRFKYANIKPKRKKSSVNLMFHEKNKIFLLILSVASIFFGSLAYKFFEIDYVTENVITAFSNFQASNWLKIFIYFIETDLIFLLFAFFIGTSYLGSFIVSLPLILKCLLIGYQGTAIYNEYDLKGVLFCLVLLYPCYVITTATLIYACDESNYMSKSLFNSSINKNTANTFNVRLYVIRYLILAVVSIVCIAVNSFLICIIAPKLSLI